MEKEVLFNSSTGEFAINETDILADGPNRYYLETKKEDIYCQDVSRSIFLDREFLGIEEVYLECELDSDCDEGEMCSNGKCVARPAPVQQTTASLTQIPTNTSQSNSTNSTNP